MKSSSLLSLLFLASVLSFFPLSDGATFQQVSIPSSVGAFIPRSRGGLTRVSWTPNFNHVLSYGVAAFGSPEHLNLIRINNGTLYRRLANTTFQLEQYGFSVSTKASITVPGTPPLDKQATSRTRGHVATVFSNTSRGFNATIGTDDRPYLTLFGGDSNGTLSELSVQLFFELNRTFDPSLPNGERLQSDPKFGAYLSGNAAFFAREGATGTATRAQVSTDVFARIYYFGGKNGSMWFNTLFFQEPSLAGTNAFTVVSDATGTVPSPRAYHGMALVDSTTLAGRYLLVWGGETGANTYDGSGPYVYDVAAKQWLNHASTGGPSARMGHALVNLGDPDVVYVFGGTDGTTFYNDLWSYQLSNRSWTLLRTGDGLPFPGGAEIRPTPRAFMHTTAFDANTFIFFGGENQFGAQSDMWSVNVNVTCPYYCVHPVDENFQGACMDYQQCHFIKDCAWDPSQAFQCFLGCNSNPSQCQTQLDAFTCPSGLTKCWSGFCQQSIENCKPYPACPFGMRRCGDNGDCVAEGTFCAPVVCNANEHLCADGKCRASCFPSYGCLPGDNPIQCADGTCNSTWARCNDQCLQKNASLPVRCWLDCKTATSQCEQPYWTDDIHLLAFTTPAQAYYRLYRKDGTIQDPQDLRGIIHLDKIPVGFNLTIYMKSAFNSELREVGPHPTWPTEFDAGYLRSLFVKTNVTNVVEAYRQGSGGINIIFRMALNKIEKEYWAYHPGHGLGYIAATNCVAYAIPWFWDDMDLEETSGLANISYIKAYREKTKALAANQTYTGPEPTPPRLRWQCQLLDPGNAWPRFTNVSDDIMIPEADRYVGIRITEDFYERIMGVIYAPFPIAAPNPPAPIAKLPPPNPAATYVVIAIAAILLLALIIVVLFKTFGQRN